MMPTIRRFGSFQNCGKGPFFRKQYNSETIIFALEIIEKSKYLNSISTILPKLMWNHEK